MGIEEIRQIVDDVQGEIEEILETEDTKDPMVFGQLLAYAETLSIIQSACAGKENEIGLDYDIDARIFFVKEQKNQGMKN